MRGHRRRMVLLAGVVLLATVPAVTQELAPDTTAATRGAWTSFEGAALLAEPVEVSLTESVRQQCEGFGLPPQPTLLHAAKIADDGELAQLEGLAACVTNGPLNGYELEIVGASELPGALEYPVESSGPADVLRAALARLGVPFRTLRVSDVEQSPMGSAHPGARVSVGVSGELASNGEEAP